MKRIALRNGTGFVIVDNEDAELVEQTKWHAKQNENGHWTILGYHGGQVCILARVIMCAKKGEQVDHINGDVFDNRRSNLRKCNNAQNSWNRWRRKSPTSTSRYKGVCRVGKKWRATIGYNYHKFEIGLFDEEEDAALAYNVAAQICFGEFARLNDI